MLSAQPQHGIAMYGDPALPADFTALPYANPDAPKGGNVAFGNTGSFDSLNPYLQKGDVPWQLRFWGVESLMGRSWDEPFALYGLLAESIETDPDRTWVEFTLRPAAAFSDGSPVTVDDVIWSYQTLGTQGNLRYRGLWSKIDKIETTGPRKIRITFNTPDRELALIAGLRPILQKAQWQDREFSDAPSNEPPITTSPYMITKFEMGRFVQLTRNPDYWGKDVPFRRGTNNFDQMRIEFFGDGTVAFEAFKAGELSAVREFNADKWATQYNFPRAINKDVVQSEFAHQKPSGMTGLVMNSRRAPFDDWRVRQALTQAFNFEYINDTMTGGSQPRITSYFSGSQLAMTPGAAPDDVRALLAPFRDDLAPGTLDGLPLPVSDGTARNRKNIRAAAALLDEAGWTITDGERRNANGQALTIEVLLRNGDSDTGTVVDLYSEMLARLGIKVVVNRVDDAQYTSRTKSLDFDMTYFRRALSLSPGNEQRLYWGSADADTEGTRNLMGVKSPAVDAMIDAILSARTRNDFLSATHALDRVLTAGRYVIPFWSFAVGRIAHAKQLHAPDVVPIYGDGPDFMPGMWWYQD
jgi:peptide/nickel transport system substrate-binding protein